MWQEHQAARSLGCGLHEGLLLSASRVRCLRKVLANSRPYLGTEDKQDLLQQDVFTFMQRSPKGVLLVHVDEHRSMCPDRDFRRGAMRVLAELPGVQVVATYTDIPPLPKQKSSETCRRPIACLLPDVGTIMKERLPMDDIDMGNEAILAILLRVATLRVTLGLALQKLLLAGLHVPCSETDRMLDNLNNMLGNAVVTMSRQGLGSASRIATECGWRTAHGRGRA